MMKTRLRKAPMPQAQRPEEEVQLAAPQQQQAQPVQVEQVQAKQQILPASNRRSIFRRLKMPFRGR